MTSPAARRRAHSRRFARLAAAATGCLAATLAIGAPASASGGILTRSGVLDLTAQRVTATWANGQQTMLLDLEVTGDGTAVDPVLVIATPAQPTITTADPNVVTAFATATSPLVVQEEQWWPDLDSFSSGEVEGATADVVTTLAPGGQSDLGNPGADPIFAWFAAAGYPLSQGETRTISTYGAGGWWFTVLAITAPTIPADRVATNTPVALPTLQLSFPSPELVVPLLFASTSDSTVELRTTVLGTERMDRTDPMRGLANVDFAGTIATADEPALTDWLAPYGGTAWATTVSQTFPSPTQITTDLRFTPSTYGPVDRGTQTEVIRRVIWGMPAGLVLVAGGMILLALVGITISQLMQRRYR